MADPTSGALPGFFRELEGLERDAAVLAGKLRAAEAVVSEAAGRDPSEQVRVVLAALGRIASVEVEPRWRSRVDPGDLPAAVLMAYQEAGKRRLETWASEISRPDPTPSRPDQPPVSDTGNGERSAAGPGSGPSDESSRESIRRLWYLLQDATDQLDDVVRDATARGQAVVTGRDPGRYVTASLTGAGELLDLALDQAWVAEAGDRELGTAMTAAITDGYALVDRRARESTSQWPFPDLDRLSGSPAALLATLGLPVADTDHDRRQG